MKTIIYTNYVKKILFLALVLLTTVAFAQEEEEDTAPKFTFSGSVDAYYRANFNGLNKMIPDEDGNTVFTPTAPGSSFANDAGFSFGMANLIAGYEGEKVGFVADLVFGPRGEDAVFGSPFGSPNIVNQLYVFWKVSEKTTLTFGNFNTFLGYEVISPVPNFNYSTSYMFSYGPFSHSGLKANFDLGSDWSAMVAVLNPTDFTDMNPFGELSFGGQLGYSGQFLNVLYGKQGGDEYFDGTDLVELDTKALFQIDYTGGFDLSESFFMGINATYQDTDGAGFYGAALYPQLTTSENFAIGLRGEYFAATEGFGNVAGIGADADGDANVFAVTLTGNATIGNLMIKPELRLDTASEDVFMNSDLEFNGSLASFVLAAVYAF
ncbi:MAG: porin [Sediminicola sp.]|tara:strand:- start:39947 stop:41083 length:1137 start_codon:yes stop_codon:yes gene_type:complete